MRITDVNVLYHGTEPKFDRELTESELMATLNWYSKNKDKKDSVKYATDFLKKKYKIINIQDALKGKPSTFGFVCRIISNGGVLSEKNEKWLQCEIQEIKSFVSKTPITQVDSLAQTVPVPNIQDRIREKANECIAELEGQIDDLLISKFSKNINPVSVLKPLDVKSVHTRFIVEWAKAKRIEFDDVLNTDDKEVKEGYSNFSKSNIKKLITFYDQVIIECNNLTDESVKSRKPRKRKAKTPEQLVAKIKVLSEFDEFKLKSIATKDIIGALQLWIYNTKTRKLGVYHAEDAGGFSVKGSSLTNFSESKSIQKKLRKPEDILPKVMTGGKVALRNLIGEIRAVESSLTGRLNQDTILMRVIK